MGEGSDCWPARPESDNVVGHRRYLEYIVVFLAFGALGLLALLFVLNASGSLPAPPVTATYCIDEKFKFLRGSKRVVDLGIAPGGWAQVVRKQIPRAAVAGIDLLPVDPIDGVQILQMDFMHDAAPDALIEALGGRPDLVLSDMAANTVGHPQTDALRTMGLVETALDFAVQMLEPGGSFVAKVFAGGADSALVAEMKRNFATVKHAKPPASRKDSSEWYVVAQGFKGAPASA